MNKEIIIIAGGNGVGKTTFARAFLQEYPDYEFLNADEIAKSLSAENPSEKKISAGRLFFQKMNEAVEQDKSLLIESTLSGRYLQKSFETWRKRNYQITIVFLFVNQPEILIERIAERVRKGGHFVPDEDVRRRFLRGKQNFWNVYKNLADSWGLIYNAESRFYEVALGKNREIEIFDENLYQKILADMKNGKSKINSETYRRMAEFVRIGNRAVRQAQEENHRLGLPNIYSRNGKLIYEMPNGEIIVKEIPQNGEQ